MSDSKPSPNQSIIDEVNEAGAWFLAKKVNPIWVRKLDRDETVVTLEGTLHAAAGNYLCRGIEGELWPQSPERLETAYIATDEIDADGFHRFDPHPDFARVLAAAIDHEFQLIVSWGRLQGKAGDFLVRNFAERGIEYPEDLWIVDRAIFAATYEAVADSDSSAG